MLKKTIISISMFAILLFGNTSLSYATEINNEVDPGMLPDSPFYFLEIFGENVKTFFTFNKVKKAKRLQMLSAERESEANALFKNGESEKAEKTMSKQQKYLERIEEIEKSFNKEEEKKYFKSQKYFMPESSPQDNPPLKNTGEFMEEKKEKKIMPAKNKIESEPTPVLSSDENSGGKGSGEDGEGVRPNDSSPCSCSKLYECKISCGENMIEKCTQEYDRKDILRNLPLLNYRACLDDCVFYMPIPGFGCMADDDCTSPCLSDYFTECHPDVYNSCVSNCDNMHGDCEE